MLLAGVPGVEPAKVVIIGGGVVGANAAQMAVGCANVVVLDRNIDVLRQLDAQFGGAVQCVYSTKDAIEKHVLEADLVVGGVLVAGAAAPKLVTAEMIKKMKPGAAIVDVAIDQGGVLKHHTQRLTAILLTLLMMLFTTISEHAGAVARTSTFALNNVTLPYILKLADKYKAALQEDKHLLNGLNVYRGQITCEEVSEALDLPYLAPEKALA